MPFIRKILFFTISVMILGVSAQGFNHSNFNRDNSQTESKIQTVSGMSLSKRALLGGTVISSAQVNLSAQIPGDVLSVRGKEGDLFKKGDVLVVLEQESIHAKRESAKAAIASANEEMKNASVQYSQSIVSPYSNSNSMFGGMPAMFSAFTDPMLRSSGRGNPDFDRYANRTSRYTQYQQAKNKFRQAQYQLRQVDELLKDANVVAPFDGVIVMKNINQGGVVQAGQTLMKFANIEQLQVEVNVPSRLVSSLKLNKKYRIKLDIAHIVVSASLAQIYPIADNNKHSVKVKFDLPLDTRALPGAYAEVEIFETDVGVLMPIIPQTAIIWRSSLPSVFIINPKTSKTELRFVRLGEEIGAGQKSVLSGLKIGEKIVVNPDILMVSGMDI